jgi:hypothetical protein
MSAVDLTILSVIQSKLPTSIFDADPAMDGIVQDVFVEMETCFRKRFYYDADNICQEDWARVGDVQYYNPIERSIIGDFASWRYLLRKLIDEASKVGLSLETASGQRFIKKAKAGSAEAEFEQRDLRNNPMIVKIGELLRMLKEDVRRKARNIGCVIDINDDNAYTIEVEGGMMEFPLLMIRENCGCR